MKPVALVLLFALGCGSKTPPPTNEPVGNRAAPEAATPDGPCELRGQIVDSATNEPLIGATLVLEGAKHTSEKVGISDENGRFVFTDLPFEVMNVYYMDRTMKFAVTGSMCGRNLRVPYVTNGGVPGDVGRGQIMVL